MPATHVQLLLMKQWSPAGCTQGGSCLLCCLQAVRVAGARCPAGSQGMLPHSRCPVMHQERSSTHTLSVMVGMLILATCMQPVRCDYPHGIHRLVIVPQPPCVPPVIEGGDSKQLWGGVPSGRAPNRCACTFPRGMGGPLTLGCHRGISAGMLHQG
jgi:hypothetical protein